MRVNSQFKMTIWIRRLVKYTFENRRLLRIKRTTKQINMKFINESDSESDNPESAFVNRHQIPISSIKVTITVTKMHPVQ